MVARLRVIFAFALFFAGTLPMALVQLIALRTGWFSDMAVPRLWHQLVLKCLGMRVEVRGQLAPNRPLLVAANHVSWTDIMVIGAHADVRFIAKSDVSGWPGIKWIAALNRTVFVERERRGKTGEQASEIATRLAGGEVLVLFPEGTTADGTFMLPFKTSLFGAATPARHGNASVWIQPVAVAYLRRQGTAMNRKDRALTSWAGGEDLITHVLRLLRERSIDAEVRFGEPIELKAGGDRKQAARQVEASVRVMFEQMLAGRG
jgi:1-acyl-sn-glycerol-3-phosphate acyltransferase